MALCRLICVSTELYWPHDHGAPVWYMPKATEHGTDGAGGVVGCGVGGGVGRGVGRGVLTGRGAWVGAVACDGAVVAGVAAWAGVAAAGAVAVGLSVALLGAEGVGVARACGAERPPMWTAGPSVNQLPQIRTQMSTKPQILPMPRATAASPSTRRSGVDRPETGVFGVRTRPNLRQCLTFS
jgi:hypothetical protein